MVENAGPRFAQIAVQGPLATGAVKKLTDADLAAIKRYHFVDGVVSGAPARIARTGYTGEDGWEIYVPPAEAERMWGSLGWPRRPAGQALRGGRPRHLAGEGRPIKCRMGS